MDGILHAIEGQGTDDYDETIDKLERWLDGSETIFMPSGGRYLTHYGRHTVRVTPNPKRHTCTFGCDTKVVIAAGREAATRAMASFIDGFVIKKSGFWCEDGRGNRTPWEAGSTIFFGYERSIGDGDPGDEVRRISIGLGGVIVRPLKRVNEGAGLCKTAFEEHITLASIIDS